MAEIILESTIVCPECGFAKEEVMPTDSCLYYYECNSCKALLKPLQGDCCVFCSYGSMVCPPLQESGACGNTCTSQAHAVGSGYAAPLMRDVRRPKNK